MKQISEELLGRIINYYKSHELKTALGITFPSRDGIEICQYGKIMATKRIDAGCSINENFLEDYLEQDDVHKTKI